MTVKTDIGTAIGPETMLFAFFDAIPVAVYVCRPDGPGSGDAFRTVFVNEALAQILELEPSEAIGAPVGDLFPDTSRGPHVAAACREALLDRAPRDLGINSLGEDWFAVSAFPLGTETVAVLFDNLSAAHPGSPGVAAIVQSTENAILSTSRDGTILTWNAAAERIYGYPAIETLGRSVKMLVPAGRAHEIDGIVARLTEGDQVVRLRTQRTRKDGASIDVALTIVPIKDSLGRMVGMTAISRDIGEQLRDEARTQQLAAIIDANESAVIGYTTDGIVTTCNPAAEQLFALSAPDVVGSSIDALFGMLAPDGDSGGHETLEGAHGKLPIGPVPALLRRPDGSERFVSLCAFPVATSSGETISAACMVRDVTKQRLLEQQAGRSSRLEAIGSLAGGVAHDFNNILTVVRSASESLRTDQTAENLSRRIDQIDLAAAHAGALTRQLLAIGLRQPSQRAPADLNAVVDSSLELVTRLMGDEIKVERQLEPGLRPVSIDRARLEQVILNLVINARDAMPTGGTLTVRTSSAGAGEHGAVEVNRPAGSHSAILEIADSGVGMDTAVRDRIFEPFFTTKPNGSGVGLSTLKDIVSQSGGRVSVRSVPGKGTTFLVELACIDGAEPAPDRTTTAAETIEGSETILLVEDSDLVRPVVADLLERYGYTVLSAADGLEALVLFNAHAGGIDLLLTDVVLPRMDGHELSEQLLRADPGLTVLFTSGYPDDTVLRHGVAPERVAFIQKPFAGEELLTRIRALLASKPERPSAGS